MTGPLRNQGCDVIKKHTRDDELLFHRTQAMEQVERALAPLMEHDPDGVHAILALWSFVSNAPTKADPFETASKALPMDVLAYQALSLGDAAFLEALIAAGGDLANLKDMEAPEEASYFKPRFPDESGMVARLALLDTLGTPNVLSVLSQTLGGRVACSSLPMEGHSASWLALALHAGRAKDAEVIWKQGQPWSLEDKAEAALAVLGSERFDEWVEKNPKLAHKWAERLFEADVLARPVPVKQGWARSLEPVNRIRFNNLKEHLESSLRKAERNEPVDMLGVLHRAFGLHAGTSQPETLRPVDFFLHGLGRWARPDQSADFPLEKWVRQLDWTALGEDSFGRPPAFALAEACIQQAKGKNSVSAELVAGVTSGILLPAVASMAEHEQNLWWSMAVTAAASTSSRVGGWLLHDTQSLFRGRMEFSDAEGVLSTLADRLKKVESDSAQSTFSRLEENQEREIRKVQAVLETLGPVLIFTGNADAAERWSKVSQELIAQCKRWDRRADDRQAKFKELVLALSLPEAPAPKKSGPRL